MGKLSRLIFIVFLLSGIRCGAQQISGRVVHVHDGDSFTIIGCDSITHKVRLWGVDAPELKQPGGIKSLNMTNACIGGRMVKLEVLGHEKYGRLLALVHVEDGPYKGVMLNEVLINSGYAWVYFPQQNAKYTTTVSDFRRIELDAQHYKRGIWNYPNNTPPWEYRKNKR